MANEFYEALQRKSPDDLEHYGVKGMQWGIRRQYPNDKECLNWKSSIEMPDPAKANRGAYKYSKKYMKKQGFKDPETPERISDMDFDDFRKMITDKKVKKIPEGKNVSPEQMERLQSLSELEAGRLYVMSKIINERNKRRARKEKK